MNSPKLSLAATLIILAAGTAIAALADHPDIPRDPYRTELRGQIVRLDDVLRREYKVALPSDQPGPLVALKTDGGHYYPLLRSDRGRAFFTDKRLLDRSMLLRVRKFPGIPTLQVIFVQSIKEGVLHNLDYYCDVCNISVPEIMQCPCCQADVYLREVPAPGQRPDAKDQKPRSNKSASRS